MFSPITIPFGGKMLFNVVKLKEGVQMEDVELALGDMCNVVKNTYGDDEGGFIVGQVFKYDGFISDNGSVGDAGMDGGCETEDHIAIVTYWESYEQHEASHADATFLKKFNVLAEMCTSTYELGYSMLWQGEPEE